MAKFKLSPYSIRVRNKHKTDNLDLSSLGSSKGAFSLFSIVEEICKLYNSNIYDQKKDKKTLCFVDCKFDKSKGIIYGFIKSGEYGYEVDFVDTKSKKRTLSARKEEDSEEFPFFFLFYLPKKNKDLGFLILSKFKTFGAKSIFQKVLTDSLKEYNEDLIIEITPLINEEMIKMIEDSKKLMEIRFIKKQVPKDVAEKNLIKNYEDITETRIFKIKEGGGFSGIILKVKDKIVNALRNVKYPYVEINNEKYDKVQLIMKEDDITRTIDIEDMPRFRESLPLDPDFSNLSKGFPKEEFLYKKAKAYVNKLLKTFDEEEIA